MKNIEHAFGIKTLAVISIAQIIIAINNHQDSLVKVSFSVNVMSLIYVFQQHNVTYLWIIAHQQHNSLTVGIKVIAENAIYLLSKFFLS